MSMAEKLSVDNNIHELILGNSFDRSGNLAVHSMRYDFKPASVDTSQVSSVEIGEGNSVTVTVPHVEGSGTSHTVYKGNKRPVQKECILIIDHKTGEFTLEKLSNTIQLKKTRIEKSSKPSSQSRPVTPIEQSKKTKDNRNSPTSVQKNNSGPIKKETISFAQDNHKENKQLSPMSMISTVTPVSVMSDNSSESSDSTSSESESDEETHNIGHNISERKSHSPQPGRPVYASTLSEDLRLSESGSDSD